MSWENIRDARLENEHLLLRRILPEDREQLHEIAMDPEIWRYFVSRVSTDQEFGQFMADNLDDTNSGRRVVFCILDKKEQRTVGSMSYGNLAEKEKRLEIGWSWLGKKYRGAGINRWAKYLLLQYAFETLGCERVEFKTDVLNLQARKGLRNIGAKEEGVFRSYNFMPDNRRRDAVYYSILKSEWSEVKNMLLTEGKPANREPSLMEAQKGREHINRITRFSSKCISHAGRAEALHPSSSAPWPSASETGTFLLPVCSPPRQVCAGVNVFNLVFQEAVDFPADGLIL